MDCQLVNKKYRVWDPHHIVIQTNKQTNTGRKIIHVIQLRIFKSTASAIELKDVKNFQHLGSRRSKWVSIFTEYTQSSACITKAMYVLRVCHVLMSETQQTNLIKDRGTEWEWWQGDDRVITCNTCVPREQWTGPYPTGYTKTTHYCALALP